jgi:hypothetical protein
LQWDAGYVTADCHHPRWITVRSLLLPLLLMALSLVAGTRCGHATPADEADRLYAQALGAWDRSSTSFEVEDLLREALRLQRSALTPTDPRITATLDHLGRVFYNRGAATADPRQFEEAVGWFRETVDLARRAIIPDSMLLGDYISDLAAAQREAGQPRAALPNVCEGLRIRLSLRPPRADRITRSLATLARTRAALGGQREVSELLRNIDAIQKVHGDGPSIGTSAYERNCEDSRPVS